MPTMNPIRLKLRPTVELIAKPFPRPQPPIMPAIIATLLVDGTGRQVYDLRVSLEWRNFGDAVQPAFPAVLRIEYDNDGGKNPAAYAEAMLPELEPRALGRVEVSITLDHRPRGVWLFHELTQDVAPPRG